MTVNIVFPPLAAGAPVIWTQVEKLSPETWKLPLHDVFAVFVVRLAGSAGTLKVTLTVVSAATEAPSAGLVAVTASAAFVVKPGAWSNCATSGTPAESWAPVVTRIRYAVDPVSSAAGLTVKVVSPLLAAGEPAIWTQVAKLSLET